MPWIKFNCSKLLWIQLHFLSEVKLNKNNNTQQKQQCTPKYNINPVTIELSPYAEEVRLDESIIWTMQKCFGQSTSHNSIAVFVANFNKTRPHNVKHMRYISSTEWKLQWIYRVLGADGGPARTTENGRKSQRMGAKNGREWKNISIIASQSQYMQLVNFWEKSKSTRHHALYVPHTIWMVFICTHSSSMLIPLSWHGKTVTT